MHRPPSGRPRRHLLRAIAVGGVAGLAGCQDGSSETDLPQSETEPPTDESEATDEDRSDGDGDGDGPGTETDSDDSSTEGDESDDTGQTRTLPIQHLQILIATGAVNNDAVDEVSIVVAKSAGIDAIDLSTFTIMYISTEASVALQHGGTGADAATDSTFSSAGIAGTDSATTLTETDDRIELTVDIAAIHGTAGLAAGSSATFKFIDRTGSTFTYGVETPSTYGDNEYVSL